MNAIAKLKALAIRLHLGNNYDPSNGRTRFLIDVAHKIGLKDVSDNDMLDICNYNYDTVVKKVQAKKFNDDQKNKLFLLGRLRNLIAYDCGAGASSMRLISSYGEGRYNGLPEDFFK